MEYELEYFTEFLNDPSVPDVNEFFRMLKLWCNYLAAHKADFNYLEDDEWTEIRERLLDEMDIRFDVRDDLRDEWEEMIEEGENIKQLSFEEGLEYGRKRLAFMKAYPYIIEASEEEIAEYQTIIDDFAAQIEKVRFLENQRLGLRLHADQSLAALDEDLADYYEKTGKIIMLPRYGKRKNHKGN